MRHKVKTKKIGKDAAHQKSIMRNLTKALIYKERITTTNGKVKVFQSFVEKIITRSKVDTLHNRRMVYRDLRDTQLLKKLFENIGKRYVSRAGGYTRIMKLNQRNGDGSEMCILELVEEKLGDSTPTKKESKKAEAAKLSETVKTEKKAETEVVEAVETEKLEEKTEELKVEEAIEEVKSEVEETDSTKKAEEDKKD